MCLLSSCFVHRESERVEFAEAKDRLKHSWAADRDDFARVKEQLKKKNAEHHLQNGRLSQALKVIPVKAAQWSVVTQLNSPYYAPEPVRRLDLRCLAKVSLIGCWMMQESEVANRTLRDACLRSSVALPAELDSEAARAEQVLSAATRLRQGDTLGDSGAPPACLQSQHLTVHCQFTGALTDPHQGAADRLCQAPQRHIALVYVTSRQVLANQQVKGWLTLILGHVQARRTRPQRDCLTARQSGSTLSTRPLAPHRPLQCPQCHQNPTLRYGPAACHPMHGWCDRCRQSLELRQSQHFSACTLAVSAVSVLELQHPLTSSTLA